MDCQCERFQIGDIVSFGILPNARFYGTVKQIDAKIKKIFVDVNGKVAQFDPEEIQVVLEQALLKQARRASKKTALYWSQSPRKYKKTQSEAETGEVRCPKCKSIMNPSRYTKKCKIHICPDCDFKITTDSIVDKPEETSPVENIVDDVRFSSIAKKLVSPLRDRRDYGEGGSINSDLEEIRGESREAKIARQILADDYDYTYDSEHEKKPSGGGWEKTEKGWSKKKEVKDKGKTELGKGAPPKQNFNQNTDSWFDKASSADFDVDGGLMSKIDNIIKNKPATKQNIRDVVGLVKDMKSVKEDVKKQIWDHMGAIENNDFKGEFKNQYGGGKNDSKSSAGKEFLSQLHQSLFYNKGSEDKKIETPKTPKIPKQKSTKKFQDGTNVRVYDDGGKTTDRYTVVLDSPDWDTSVNKGEKAMIGLSGDPESPQGFSQFTSGQEGKHLGKLIEYDSLPEHLRKHIENRIESKPVEEKSKGKPYKKLSPVKGTLDPVKTILKHNDLKDDSDEIKELAGFKNSIKHHQRLTQDAAKELEEDHAKFWPRNAEKLKAEFIKHMDSSNYSSPQAFQKAKDRMSKIPPQEFGKIIDAITDDEEV